jgi:hypothetical protein
LSDPVTDGINDLRQLRLGDVEGPNGNPTPTPFSVAPEPMTWALMLIGFGFVGGAMRRRTKHQSVRLTYA